MIYIRNMKYQILLVLSIVVEFIYLLPVEQLTGTLNIGSNIIANVNGKVSAR